MSDHGTYSYPDIVKREISASDYEAYLLAAAFINQSGYDALSVQHEYGIFGGPAGHYLLALLREINIPVITTMHTVLRQPDAAQRAVTAELLQLSERIIVMSAGAVQILINEYAVSPMSIDLIPHGIPDFTGSPSTDVKKSLGISGQMILTFGLLSPDKGIEYAIQAMPEVLSSAPDSVYVVLGETHPNIKLEKGEVYRDSLIKLTQKLGITESVLFIDQFVSQLELTNYLQSADIYITPYLNPQQITSGTLTYALGAGKAVISTPYLYANELLADGRGILVPFRDAHAIAKGILELNLGTTELIEMGRRASEYCHQMQWPQIGAQYCETFSKAIIDNTDRLRKLISPHRDQVGLPAMTLQHLSAMTDDTGMFQHAVFNVPNRSHGYCVDDNARALLLTAYLESSSDGSNAISEAQSCYLSFVHDSFNPENGRFRNFMSYNRVWLEDEGSDDSHARTLWSLAATASRAKSSGHRAVAAELFRLGVPAVLNLNSPRAWAYSILASDEFLRGYPTDVVAHDLRSKMAFRLWNEYKISRSEDWHWFESVVSYANARLSQALIVSGQWLGNHEMLAAGIESLTWLMRHQTGEAGQFRPIGSNGFSRRGQQRAEFDQQPLEAWASISACISASRATGNGEWKTKAERIFRWFLGDNALSLSLYDETTGGCRDGLHPDRVNENQGAESTLSFLCSLAEIHSALRPTPLASKLGNLY